LTRCFVVGPIGDRLAPLGSPGRERYEEALEVFEKVILPACISNDLDPVRADQIAVSGEITQQIFRHLYEDEVVVADVSGGNANVMYELGLRHTRDLLTVQIGEYGQLPFDITAVRTIQFSRSERGLIDARNELTRALAVGLAEGSDPVTATRIWNQEPIPAARELMLEVDESEADGEAVGEQELDEDGFMDHMARTETALPQLQEAVSDLTEVLTLMGSDAQDIGVEINVLNQSAAPASARLTLLARYGKGLQERADEFERRRARYTNLLEDIDSSVSGLFEFIETHPDSLEQEGVRKFLESIGDLARSSREAMGQLNGFAGMLNDLGSLSRSLRRPGRQLANSVQAIARATSVMDAWEAAAARIRARGAAGAA